MLIVPQFLAGIDAVHHALPDRVLRWSLEGWMGGEPAEGSVPASSFDAVDTILAYLNDRSNFPALRRIVLAGHSAGAQLVQRYADKPAIEWTPLFWSVLRSRITDIRRRRRVRSVLIGWMGSGDEDEGPAWEPADPTPGPAHVHSDRESYKALAAALEALPRRQREAYQLRVLEGLDVADTARVMGCSEGSVKTHTSRAMDALRKQLEDWR